MDKPNTSPPEELITSKPLKRNCMALRRANIIPPGVGGFPEVLLHSDCNGDVIRFPTTSTSVLGSGEFEHESAYRRWNLLVGRHMNP